MNDRLQVTSTQRVALELPIAGLGSRAMAYLVDVGLLGGVALVAYFVFTLVVDDPLAFIQGFESSARIGAAIGAFLVLWGYWTISEVLLSGQTLGKRLMRIRVVARDGGPVTIASSAIRNLVRLIDFAPLCYPVGLTTMLLDGQHRRLGDLLAGTVLIREPKIDLARYEGAQAALASDALELTLSYLERFDQLEPAAQLRVGAKLAQRLGVEPATDAQELRGRLSARVAR